VGRQRTGAYGIVQSRNTFSLPAVRAAGCRVAAARGS
jgi:hypothetical protein